MNWKSIKMPGVGRIDRIVATYEVWSDGNLPFAKFQVKVVERAGGDFAGSTNVAIRNPLTGELEWIAGLGDSADEALKDVLERFFREIKQYAPNRALEEDDFEWGDPYEF